MRIKSGWVGIILAGVLLVGCGCAASPQATSSTSHTATPSPTPAATIAPTPLPTADQALVAAACGWDQRNSGGTVQVGDLFISRVGLGLAHPAQMLPDGTPLKPFRAATATSISPAYYGSPMVNPSLTEGGGSFGIAVCNGSRTQSHVVQGISIRIDTLTPYGGQLNAWKACDDAYSRRNPGGPAGCGGTYGGDEYLHATFSRGARAGTVVAAVQTGVGTFPGSHGPLPVAPAHGSTLGLSTGLTLPSTPATYTFSVGVNVDGVAPIWLPVSGSMLFAPVAHEWSGQACSAPAMQSQLPPATNPPSYYICPKS